MTHVMFSSGEYEGRPIEEILSIDPAYIVWAYSNTEDTKITHAQYERAVRMLDEWDGNTVEFEDAEEAVSYATERGWFSDGD